MTDLVERLRESWAVGAQVDLFQEAADEIERLRAAIEYVRSRSARAAEILNELRRTE